jgi:hypothetical protein
MFSSEHAIWKFADAGDEIDDWLPYAEDLVREWSTQNSDEVKFGTTFEIILAAFLLEDDLLPASAKAAFAKVMLEAINEAGINKLSIKCLHIRPPKPGRKENRTATFIKCHEVTALIQKGMTATEAYKVVAEKHFKSPDTIRRDYERIVKRMSKRKETGENDR